MFQYLFGIFVFALGIYPVTHPQANDLRGDVYPTPSIAEVKNNDQENKVSQTQSPKTQEDQSTKKSEAYNKQSEKPIGEVSVSAIKHSPVIIPCQDLANGCSDSPKPTPQITRSPIYEPIPTTTPGIIIPTGIARPNPTPIPWPTIMPEPIVDPVIVPGPILPRGRIDDPIIPPPPFAI